MVRDNLVAVIMAGGRGERLWPRSTHSTPKHLLKFGGEKAMVAETVDRLKFLVSLEKIFIVTSQENAQPIKKLFPQFPLANIITEPFSRNTAACIGLAAVFVKRRFPEAVIAIFPSDHVINERRRFAETIRFGAFWAEREKSLVIVGLKPNRPETGYGYIELGGRIGGKNRLAIHRVKRFVEKPDLKKAKGFVSSGRYLWNAGMFIFKVEEILKTFKLFMPEFHRSLLKIEAHLDKTDEKKVINRVYKGLKSISIDYGVMEKADNVLVVPSTFGWNDVGSWTAIDDLLPRDEHGVVAHAEHISIDTKDCIIYSPKKLVASIGVSDLIVVETEDALLICHKSRAQDVKKVVEILEKEGKERYL